MLAAGSLPPVATGSDDTARPEDGSAPADPADVLEIGSGVSVALHELSWQFSAAGGPGGQHVNTANTKVQVRFDIARSPSLPEWARARLLTRLGPTVAVTASDRRSQLRNRQLALDRLAERLRGALCRGPPRRATRPTKASQRRRVEAKRRHGDRKRQRQTGRDED
jgi:ribosome-associated protein